MKLYGVEIEEKTLVKAIEDAEIESFHCLHGDILLILNTETGELFTDLRQHNSHGWTRREWEGLDVVLHTTSQYGWSPFRDWFVLGATDIENNEFVRQVIGDEAYKEIEQMDEDGPVWDNAYADYQYKTAIDEAVVNECIGDLMQAFDSYYVLEKIVQDEANHC